MWGGKIQRFVFFGTELLFGVLLVLLQEFWVETNVAWFIDSMDISKTSCNGEIWAYFSEISIDIPNILRLSI